MTNRISSHRVKKENGLLKQRYWLRAAALGVIFLTAGLVTAGAVAPQWLQRAQALWTEGGARRQQAQALWTEGGARFQPLPLTAGANTPPA
jgi:hypothetical protein